MEKDVTFKAIINGECLNGPSNITIAAGATGKYHLAFKPLYIFRDKATIAFVNDELGEIWYELLLSAEENPPVKLPLMKCELGKSEKTKVNLENPYPRDIKASYRNTNPENFEILMEKVIIPGSSSIDVEIKYTPSDLENTESGVITFETDEVGCWNFMVFGIGIPPTKFPVKQISGSLNKDCTGSINFRNPFRETIAISLLMDYQDDKAKQVFELLLKKTKLQCTPQSVLQIPFSFQPKGISFLILNEKRSVTTMRKYM